MTDEEFTDEALVNNVCNCSLYAHWVPNEYNVTLDVNGGDALPDSEKNVTVLSDKAYDPFQYPIGLAIDFDG